MINNFDVFKRERKEGEFYFVQVIKRKKDNPDVAGINGNNHARCIKEYSIYDQTSLDKRKQEIIDIATTCNARIYIHPARRSRDKIGKLIAVLIAEHNYNGRHNLSGIYRHACGLDKGVERLWIVDIDNKDAGYELLVRHLIDSLATGGDTEPSLIQNIIPTKNGVHLITKPFNLQEFKKTYPDIDVHKNNPTLLYYPG